MTETMGQIIKRLRKERGLTQEELAEMLNISPPAISKWENDTAMPDISNIVPLANLFGISTDVLFGISNRNNEEDIKTRLEEIFRMCDNCRDGEESETALIILDKYREAVRLYPDNTNILTNAMAFAEMIISNNGTEFKELMGQTGIDELNNEIIRWAELVIRHSSSIDDILSAKRRLIDIYTRDNNTKEAYKIAETFPRKISDIRGIRIADLKYCFKETEEERKWHCYNIQSLIEELGNQVFMLGNLYMNEKQYEDAVYCYSFMQNVLDSLYREEEYRPPFVYDHIPLFRFPAYCLLMLGREDEAVEMLEKGVEFIKTQAKHYNKKKKLDIPLLRDCTFGYGYDGEAEYSRLKSKLKNLISGDEFKPLEKHPRYIALIEAII